MIILQSLSSTTDCTINYTRLKWNENSPFQVFNMNHDHRNNNQANLTFMKNKRKSLLNTFIMKYDELTFIII